MVAYCFAEIAGFSKFTTYVGNGSTDGPFVYLGFRPKFVMVKGNPIVHIFRDRKNMKTLLQTFMFSKLNIAKRMTY